MKRWILAAAVLLLASTALYATFTSPVGTMRWNAGTMRDNGPMEVWMTEVENKYAGTALAQDPLGTGNTYYVDTNVTNEGDGTSWAKAKNTLAEAIALCTADNGDVIRIAQGSAETKSATGALFTASTAGVRIIGSGEGWNRPVYTLSHTGATIDITADNVSVQNIIIDATGVDIVVAPINISGVGSGLKNCYVRLADTVGQAAKGITIGIADGDANDAYVIGCEIVAPNAGAVSAITWAKDQANMRVTSNRIYGDFSTANLEVPTAGNAQVNLGIFGNTLVQTHASVGVISANGTGNKGQIDGNFFASDGATYVDAGGLVLGANVEKALGDSDTEFWTFDLGTNNLDHLMKTVVADDSGAIDLAEVVDKTVLSWVLSSNGDTATFIPSTMALSAQATNIASVLADTGTDGVVLAADAITAAKIGTAAIAADEIAADAIGAAELAADAVAEIADGVTDEAVAGHRTAGTIGAMLQPLQSGTASAGAAGTITLQSTASALADFYNGCVVQIIAGSGIGQSRVITDYAVTTFVANVTPNWITNPSTDSVYVVYGQGPARVEAITAGVITAGAFTAGAIDASAVATDAIGADELSAAGIAKIAKMGTADPSYGRINYLVVDPGVFDTTGAWSTISGDGEHEVLVVTGAVRIRMMIEVTLTVTSASDLGTIALGFEGATAALGAAFTLGSGVAATGEIFSVSGTTITSIPSGTLFANAFLDFVVVGGKDVGYLLATQAATGGHVLFHVWWTPLDSTGAVTAGAGGTL